MAYEETIKSPSILPPCGNMIAPPACRLLPWVTFRSATRFLLSLFHRINASLVLLFILLIITSLQIHAQESISLSWPLTSPDRVIIPSGKVNTGFGTGTAVDRVIFDRNYGAMAGGWNSTDFNPAAFYEYRIAPVEGSSLSLSQLKIDISLGSGEMHMAAKYSVDGFRNPGQQIGQPLFFYTTIPQTLTLATDIIVSYPDTLRIRVYAWGATDRLSEFNNRNVILDGTATGPSMISRVNIVPIPNNTLPGYQDKIMDALSDISFTAPGTYTWTCPADVTCIQIECWGGGGRGGTRTTAGSGGGGGGGAYSRSTKTVVPGNNYTIIVGAGDTTGTFGATSSFNYISAIWVNASGGKGVPDNSPGWASGGGAGGGDVSYSGGRGDSFSTTGGGGGSSAGTASNGNNGAGSNGGAAPAGGGPGGNGCTSPNGPGFSGGAPGAGGGGAFSSSGGTYSGGNGANGKVIIRYISPFNITPFNESICYGDTVIIGLSDSETGVTYQLYCDGSPIGSPVTGTGNALSFGDQTVAGTYTVIASLNLSTCILSMNGSVVIYPNQTITLTSSPSDTNQTVCINTAISNIIYTLGGGATGANLTGQPAGVTGTLSGNIFTISGTPSASGTFNYTVTTSGNNSCIATTTGTITVNPNATIILTSAPGTNNQSVCINTSITSITYAIGGGGTGAGVTGLPAGVTGTFSSGVFTINGTPTVAGVFNYTVTTTGTCTQATATGTITVASNATITLTSSPGTNNQSVCKNSAITPITYAIGGGGTGAGVSGLPAGVMGSYLAGVYTISGTPSVTGVFTYTVTTTGICVQASAAGTITVNPLPAVTLDASPAAICLNDSTTLTATSSGGTVLRTFSGTNSTNYNIPDNSKVGATSTIVLNSGGLNIAPTDIIQVTLNITHTRDEDLDIFLANPTASGAMHLSRDYGASGDNYTNTILKTDATVPISTGAPPFTGTFLPEGSITTPPPLTGAAPNNGGNYSSIIPANALNGVAIDGAWALRVFDDRPGGGGGGGVSGGTLINWSITITKPIGVYTCVFNGPGTIGPVTYSGPNNSVASAVVIPSAVGINNYTATTTDALGCSVTSTPISVTVHPLPDVSITADYCQTDSAGHIKLTALPGSTPTYSYLWSTGQTAQIIYVDIAAIYSVTVTNTTTLCDATSYLSVATEYVTNGDFTSGNDGSFTSDYNFKPDLPGLVPPGQGELYDDSGNNGYSVTTNGQNVHINFWGLDHTNNPGTRNFMLVNGHGTLVVWRREGAITVIPGTTYYFSAHAISLNSASPFADLQFNINGSTDGMSQTSTGILPSRPENNNPAPWTRFYGNWTAPPGVTSATITIVDLVSAFGGNDFGLDDISFGTLAPPPFNLDPEANGGGIVCQGGTLYLTANITGGIGPFSYLWTGPDGWTSTLPDPERTPVTLAMGGTYTLSIADLGTSCPGFTTSFIVTVNPAPNCFINGADQLCPFSAGNIYSGSTGMMTYEWSISGNGSIQGATDVESVNVIAGDDCDSTFTLSLTVTDSIGCSSLCTKTVLVQDIIPPVITCPPDSLNIMADPGETYATIPVLPPGYSDNCTTVDSIIITWDMTGATDTNGVGIIPVPFRFYIGTTYIKYYATDLCGNLDSCQFIVSVLPNDPPEIDCPNDTTVYTDAGLCTATFDPGSPDTISGTPPFTWKWIMSGVTVDTGYTNPIIPTPYTFNLDTTYITWIATNIAGADTCVQRIIVIDTVPPTFDTPGPLEFCVYSIFDATYDGQPEPDADIVPDRPDWYIIDGTTELDISNLDDNCCEDDELTILWTITFTNPPSYPPVSGTGQPSGAGPITLWGTTDYTVVVRQITYVVVDCNGNSSDPVTLDIIIKPRPNVIKVY